MSQEHLFVQKIKHLRTDNEFDLSFLRSLTFVETMSLDGPKLIAEFQDTYYWIKDTIGLIPGDELEVTFIDIASEDGINNVITFTVVGKPVYGDLIKINAVASVIYNLKIRAATAQVFNKKPVSFILAKMFPGCAVEADKFPAVEDYHILAGEYPSYMVRQLAKEQGANIYWRRDRIKMDSLSSILSKEPELTYYYNDASQGNQIITYNVPSSDHILGDKILRRYSGWNLTKGWQSSSNNEYPPHLVASQSRLTLKNLTKAPKPVMDIMVMGSAAIMAGQCVALIWNKLNREEPIDESLPDRVVAHIVAHHYSNNKYYVRLKGAMEV